MAGRCSARARAPGASSLGSLAIDAVEDELGVAEDGVQRRAQLVAHVGEELRLVLARDLELPALFLDLAEQARVLDRQHRLRGEGLQQINGALRKSPGSLRRTTSSADDLVRPQQRHDQQRPIAGAQDDFVDRIGGSRAGRQSGSARAPRARERLTGSRDARGPFRERRDQRLAPCRTWRAAEIHCCRSSNT